MKLNITSEQILPEQVRLLYEQLSLGAIASVINAAILCLLLWTVQPAAVQGVWFALTYKPHLPRNHTEKHGQDLKLHAGTAITRKVVNSRSRNALCFSVFRVFPWLK